MLAPPSSSDASPISSAASPASAADDGGRSGFETAFWAAMHGIFPEDARKHLKVATREQLMAARVYLDRWIARLDEQEAEKAEPPPREDRHRVAAMTGASILERELLERG